MAGNGLHFKTMLVAARDFQQCGILAGVDSDEPVCSLLLSLDTPNNVRSVA